MIAIPLVRLCFLCSVEMFGVVSFYMVPIRLSFFLEVGLALTLPPVSRFCSGNLLKVFFLWRRTDVPTA